MHLHSVHELASVGFAEACSTDVQTSSLVMLLPCSCTCISLRTDCFKWVKYSLLWMLWSSENGEDVLLVDCYMSVTGVIIAGSTRAGSLSRCTIFSAWKVLQYVYGSWDAAPLGWVCHWFDRSQCKHLSLDDLPLLVLLPYPHLQYMYFIVLGILHHISTWNSWRVWLQ